MKTWFISGLWRKNEGRREKKRWGGKGGWCNIFAFLARIFISTIFPIFSKWTKSNSLNNSLPFPLSLLELIFCDLSSISFLIRQNALFYYQTLTTFRVQSLILASSKPKNSSNPLQQIYFAELEISLCFSLSFFIPISILKFCALFLFPSHCHSLLIPMEYFLLHDFC